MNLKDLNPDEIEEVVEEEQLSLSDFSPEDIEAYEEPEVSQLESAARGAGQGLTFDFLDEILAAGRAIPEDLAESVGLKEPTGPAPKRDELGRITNLEELQGNYRKYLEEERAKMEAAKEANPWTYGTADVASGILPALLSGGATAAGKVGKEVIEQGVKGLTGEGMKQAAKVGAGYGAVVGAGMSEAEELPELAADVATGAVGGAALGGATPIAGKILKQAGKVAAMPIKAISEKLPSISTGFKFGKKYGISSNEKINNLLEDNTRDLIDVMNKSFQKLGLEKEAALTKAKETAKTYDVTEGIQDVADTFRKQAEALLPADQKQAQKISEEIEESFLKVDVQRQKLLDKVQAEIQKKVEKSSNLEKKAISKGESAAVKDAEKSGASLEQLQDIKKRFEDVSDLPYDTKGGRIAGQKAKFKDEYLDIDTGEMVPYEYSKKYVKETTPFKPSDIRVGEVDDKLTAQYTDEATGEVFTKMGPKSQFLEKDFSKLSLEELSDLTTQYGQKGFDEKDPVYKELYKVVRSKLEEAGLDIPENKKEMFNLFQTMGILGIDKTKLKYPSTEDVVQLAKKIPGKMDLEKSVIQRRLTGKDSDLAKKLDDLNLISDAKKYLGEGYTSATGEYTRAGFIQKGISSVSDIAGAAYGKVSRPVNKVANKVSQMSDEGLQYVNKQMAESPNEGVKAMGRQLDSALQQEGPVKSALIWSLSQNPAFRKTIDEYLPKLDEGLKEDLGIQRMLESGGDADKAYGEDMYMQGGMSKEVQSEPTRDPAGIPEENEAILNTIVSSQIEGGYQNQKSDSGNFIGGKLVGTNHGITPKAYKAYYGATPSVQDMKNLTKNQAKEIYTENYIKKPGFDQITDPQLRMALIDFGINSGPESSVKILQKMVKEKADGRMGPRTIAAINSYDGNVVEDFFDSRRKYIESISKGKKKKYKKGWLNRIDTIEKEAEGIEGKAKVIEEVDNAVDKMEQDLFQSPEQASPLADQIEDAKGSMDRMIKQMASGNMTPEFHMDNALGKIEDLPINEIQKETLQDELVKAETYSDIERLKRLLDGLKSS